jgi:hypothetical protein
MLPLIPLFNSLPKDVLHSQIADRLKAKEVANLRATETALWKDAELKDQQSAKYEYEVIEAAGLKIFAKESIPDIAVELKEFQRALQEDFSNKDITEIKKQINILLERLDEELVGRDYQSGEGDALPQLQEITLVKREMVYHEAILAESQQDPSMSLESPLHRQRYEENLSNTFHEDSAWINFPNANFYAPNHNRQDFAALFSSQPERMQAYLLERHARDYQLRDEWIARNFPQDANQGQENGGCVLF